MRKYIVSVIAVFLSVISNYSLAGISADGKHYFAKKFYSAYKYSNGSDLSQLKTGYNNSCGPMSMLMVNNYYSYLYNGISASFTQSTSKVKSALDRLYNFIDK